MKRLFKKKDEVAEEKLPKGEILPQFKEPTPPPQPVQSQPQQPPPASTGESREPTNEELEALVEERFRLLAEFEIQIKTGKVYFKSERNLNGVMAEQELISKAQLLKTELNAMIALMKSKGYVDKFFSDLIEKVSVGRESYEAWVWEDTGKK